MSLYIYQIVHVPTGRYYVGRHSTDGMREQDRYMGSGTHLKAAIRKYGKSEFRKEILIDNVKDLETLVRLEAQIVTSELVDDPNYFNHAIGGAGPTGLTQEQKARQVASQKGRVPWNVGVPTPVSTREKISTAMKGRLLSGEHLERKREAAKSSETRAKQSLAHQGRVVAAETRSKLAAASRGRVKSPEELEKMSAAAKLWWSNKRSGCSDKGVSK